MNQGTASSRDAFLLDSFEEFDREVLQLATQAVTFQGAAELSELAPGALTTAAGQVSGQEPERPEQLREQVPGKPEQLRDAVV